MRVVLRLKTEKNKEDIYLDHIQHLLFCEVMKTRKIVLNIVRLAREYNDLWFPQLTTFL